MEGTNKTITELDELTGDQVTGEEYLAVADEDGNAKLSLEGLREWATVVLNSKLNEMAANPPIIVFDGIEDGEVEVLQQSAPVSMGIRDDKIVWCSCASKFALRVGSGEDAVYYSGWANNGHYYGGGRSGVLYFNREDCEVYVFKDGTPQTLGHKYGSGIRALAEQLGEISQYIGAVESNMLDRGDFPVMSESAYDALAEKDNNKIYFLYED